MLVTLLTYRLKSGVQFPAGEELTVMTDCTAYLDPVNSLRRPDYSPSSTASIKMHGALPPTHRIVFIALFLRNPHTKKDLLIIWSSVQAAIMHGAARVNYTAGKLTAHGLLQHVGKWGINNCTAFYCRLGISLNKFYPLPAARLFRNSITAVHAYIYCSTSCEQP